MQHGLTVERVEDLARSARSISEDIRAAVHGRREDMRLRYIGLALVWGFIVFAVGVTYLYKKARHPPAAHDESGTPR